MTLSSHGFICALKRSDKSAPSNCRITSGLRVVFGFQEKDAMESATRWRFGMSTDSFNSEWLRLFLRPKEKDFGAISKVRI